MQRFYPEYYLTFRGFFNGYLSRLITVIKDVYIFYSVFFSLRRGFYHPPSFPHFPDVQKTLSAFDQCMFSGANAGFGATGRCVFYE